MDFRFLVGRWHFLSPMPYPEVRGEKIYAHEYYMLFFYSFFLFQGRGMLSRHRHSIDIREKHKGQ